MPLIPAEVGWSLSSKPVWSTEQVPGQPGLYRETLSPKNKNKTKAEIKHQRDKTINQQMGKWTVQTVFFLKKHKHLITTLKSVEYSYSSLECKFMLFWDTTSVMVCPVPLRDKPHPLLPLSTKASWSSASSLSPFSFCHSLEEAASVSPHFSQLLWCGGIVCILSIIF